mgnify:FL=1
MLIYDFIWRRLDQVECSDGWHAAQYMVDGLYTKNYLNLMQEDQMAEDICRELWQELDAVANPDIPF